MSNRSSLFATAFLLAIVIPVSPVFGISVSCSSGGGGESVSSVETFDLDDSSALQESINLDAGSIFKSRQADGSGNNSIDERITGNDFSLENNIQSYGTFSTSSSASANSESGALSQNVAGMGSMSISVSGSKGPHEASQAASVSYGALDSAQAITAGDRITAAQSTGMVGLEGSVLSGAVGSENLIGATGAFTGAGLLEASLSASISAETGRASATGKADLDGVNLVDDSSFEAVSSQSLEMGMEGMRNVGDGDVGGFNINVLNLEQPEMESTAALTSTSAASTAGGSYSSYVLTGYRWNQANPQIQLYLNSNNAPSGIAASETQSAVAAAANTWDDAVSSNIFADGTTVIIDNNKAVDNPFSSYPVSDGYNVVGWSNMGNSYLGMCRWWSNGAITNGYKSILEADTWLASDKTWTTDLSKATGSTFDIQSVAVHELGHTVGLGDLYTLPSSDSRKYDWNQVMNSYDGAQRSLGNGDKMGVQMLYGPFMYMAFRASNGQYVCSENGGGQQVVANRNVIGGWETYGLFDLGNGNYALKAANGQYVCAENGGGREIVANRNAIGGWETFHLIDLGNGNYALQASNGQYVCAENGGGRELAANRNAIGGWETFREIELSGNSNIVIGVSNGEYVCAENGGGREVVANRNAFGGWETFSAIDLGNNNIALRASNGQYVCAENGGGSELVANRNVIGGWETFSVIDLGNNNIALRASNGQYVYAVGGGGGSVRVNSNAIGTYETLKKYLV